MPQNKKKSADTKQVGSGNNIFPHHNILEFAGTLTNVDFLNTWLDTPSIVAFSATCSAGKNMATKTIIKRKLLTAVVRGDEDGAKKIVEWYPELLLDASTSVTDLSGKKIKGLTFLQAAICAGDVDMVQMIKEVLQTLASNKPLEFAPGLEIERQFRAIYPEGIDSVEAAQREQAEQLQATTLDEIFLAINNAKDYQVEFELDSPGRTIRSNDADWRFELANPSQISSSRRLNVALHNFRRHFTTISHQDKIFNPFYLLKAFIFYNQNINQFSGEGYEQEQRQNLFWTQVIGYIQRHLPACYLQAFAQGIATIASGKQKLKRDFEFSNEKGYYILPRASELKNLGYEYAVDGTCLVRLGSTIDALVSPEIYKELLKSKKSGLYEVCCVVKSSTATHTYRAGA